MGAPWLDFTGDAAFGPQFKDKFDFTLEFEHSILTIAPAVLLIAATPIFFFLYCRRRSIILPGYLLWLKIVFASAFIGVQAAILALWTGVGSRQSDIALAALSLSLVASLCLVPVLYLEHRHSLQSTAIVAIWLLLSLLFGGTRSRSYFLRPDLHSIGGLEAAGAGICAVLLALEEIPKDALIEDEELRKKAGGETTSGFLSRSILLWLSRMFVFGFRNRLSIDDLVGLGPTLATRYLSERFRAHWTYKKGAPSSSLVIACLRARLRSSLGTIFPRFCLSVFTVLQPFLLQSVVKFVEEKKRLPSQRDGLIGAAIIIYGGIAISNAACAHLNFRLGTAVRGIVGAEVYQKSLRLRQTEAGKSTAITLLVADTHAIVFAIAEVHILWSSVMETGFNFWLLSTFVGKATFLVVFPTIISLITAYLLGDRMPAARKAYNESMELRVSKTSDMLTQLKAIKMVGLEESVTDYMTKFEENEIRASTATRKWMSVMYSIKTFCDAITSPLVIAGVLWWTPLGNDLSSSDVFTILAIVAILSGSLFKITDSYQYLRATYVSVERVENYLALPEREDGRQTDLESFNTQPEKQSDEKQDEVNKAEELGQNSSQADQANDRVVEFKNLSVAFQGTSKAILSDMNLHIDRGDVVVIAGPTASGKSSMLNTFLGETDVLNGSLYVEAGPKAYCGQTAWIWNGTIKEVIVGYSAFDQAWYDIVVEGCLLKEDLQCLEDGDQTRTGSNGDKLSGGQKQRVALARALYARMEMTILDDIFTALDRATSAEIFSRLFGANGVFKRSMSTVIIATHSVQFLRAADRVLLIDAKGKVTMETDIDSDTVRSRIDQVQAELKKTGVVVDDELETSEDLGKPSKSQVTTTAEDEEEEDLRARQKGDVTMYLFYAQAFRAWQIVTFFSTSFMSGFLAVFPDAYVRIWLGNDPENKLFYIGYALLSVGCVLLYALHVIFWLLYAAPKSTMHLYQLLLKTVMSSKLSFITKTDHGSLLNRFSNDMYIISQLLSIGCFRVCQYIFRLITRMALVVAASVYAIAIIPFVFGIIYIVQMYYLRTSRQIRYLDLETQAPLVAQFSESATGLQHIRAFGWQHHCTEKAFDLLDASQKPYYHMNNLEQWLALVMDSVAFFAAVILIILAVWFSYITSGSGIGLAMVSLISLSLELMRVVGEWTLLETSLSALSRLRNLIRSTPSERKSDNEGVPPNWPSRGEILLENVTAKYDAADERYVLDDISLFIPAGQTTGIVGRTGSGKSSLALSLLGFLDYTGKITIDGVDISRVSLKTLRSAITTISQENIEFDSTVRQDLFPWTTETVGIDGEVNSIVIASILEQLGLFDLINEHGLDAKISLLGLSHGQKQLMCIARACFRNFTTESKIIILDEATSSLDQDVEKKVLEMFNTFFSNCTIVAVAHRTETLIDASQVVEMSKGKIVSVTGTAQEGQSIAATSPASKRIDILRDSCRDEQEVERKKERRRGVLFIDGELV